MTKLGPYKVHPVAAIFPMMDDTDLKELADDIKAHGLQDPIVVNHDETVMLDGRNRWKACRRLRLDPEVVVLDDSYTDDDLRDYIVSRNLKRRHLTAGQKAMVATKLLPFFEAEAKERKEHDEQGRFRSFAGAVPRNSPERRQNESTYKAGAAVGVSGNSVMVAKALKRETPDLAKKVASGKMSLGRANNERKKRLTLVSSNGKTNHGRSTLNAAKRNGRAMRELENPKRYTDGQLAEFCNRLNEFLDTVFNDEDIERFTPACKHIMVRSLREAINKLENKKVKSNA